VSLKEAIKSLSFFSSLDEELIEDLSAISTLTPYSKDYILHYENQSIPYLEFLVTGLAKAYKIDKHENEIFLYYVKDDSLLSEITNLETQKLNTFSNLAFQEDSKILSLDYALFKKNFLDKKILCHEFINEILLRSEKMQDLLSREFIFDAVSKVAMMLYSDLKMFNKLKRHDISLMLHIQPATLSRVLNRLKRNNIISINLGQVKVLDKNVLQNIYEGDFHG
jgi:CRP/FNR family transcriptional regulator